MFKDIGQMMKMAKDMQGKMQGLKSSLQNKTVVGTAGADMVSVTVNGKHKVLSIKIANEVVDPEDVEVLQDLIVAALSDANRKVEDMIAAEMSAVTGGVDLSDMPELV